MKNKLFLLAILCILLQAGRMLYSASLDYIFLIWNLLLAAIPYLLSIHIKNKNLKGFPLIGKCLLWLLFLPNALYIITDLKHFRVRPPLPEWFDCLLLFSFSTLALLFGLLSFYHINEIIKKYVAPAIQHTILILISFLSGFGVYLGREERWNSWDLFTKPFTLLTACIKLAKIPNVWIFSLCYGLAFLCMYYIITSLINFHYETSKNLV